MLNRANKKRGRRGAVPVPVIGIPDAFKTRDCMFPRSFADYPAAGSSSSFGPGTPRERRIFENGINIGTRLAYSR